MIIKCKKNLLTSAINIVSKAVSTKTTMPILECILLKAEGGKVYLTANNLELGIETVIDATVLEEGQVALEAKIFSDIIRKLPDSEIDLETTSDIRVDIRCEKSKFTIPCRSGDEFSPLPSIEKENSIRISQMALRDIIRQTIFSVSDNESTKMMTGEYFEVKDNQLIVISLDGHRISRRKINLAGENKDVKVVVPGKTLQELSKIINGDAEDMVDIFFSDRHLLFEFEDTRVVSRLIEGEYFKITNMMTMGHSLAVKANKKEFMGIIDRASPLIQETDKKPIIVSVKNDNNLYVRLDTNLGSMKEEMEIEKEGDEIIIGFNPKFLMDAMRVIDDDDVNIYMMDSKNPCIIKDAEESYVYIILPININTDVYA
ncbi:MAG: DNA polymerase III subunit beta [Eubacterium sp.]|nr:DNA polymerase III subunit beta [Eubacterium sp.]